MLPVAIECARSAGVQEVYANYCQTPKNKPCYAFFQRSGLTYGIKYICLGSCTTIPLKRGIRLVCDGEGAFEETSTDRNQSELITSDHLH